MTRPASPAPRRERPRNGRKVLIAALGSPVLAAIITAIVAWAPWQHDNAPGPSTPSPTGIHVPPVDVPTSVPGPGFEQSVFVNPTSGAGGTHVDLSGEGFPANARVVFVFQTEQFGETTTNSQGKFANVAATIPKSFHMFAPQQFPIDAVSGAFSAETPFMLTG